MDNTNNPNKSEIEFITSGKIDYFFPPLSSKIHLFGLTLLSIFIASLSLASILKYRVTVKAPATLRPQGEIKLVQTNVRGTVSRINLNANAPVTKNQVIATVDNTRQKDEKQQLKINDQLLTQQLSFVAEELTQLKNQVENIKEENKRENAFLKAEFDLQITKYNQEIIVKNSQTKEANANLQIAESELKQALTELKSAQAQLRSIDAQLQSAIAHQDRFQKAADEGALSKGQLEEAKLKVRQKEEELIAQQSKITGYEEVISQKRIAITGMKSKLKQAETIANLSYKPVTIAEEKYKEGIAKSRRELAQLNQQQKQLIQKQNDVKQRLSDNQKKVIKINQEIEQSQIKAPITGIIQEINLRNIDQVVQIGEVVAKIAPSDNNLQIKVKVAPQDISKIEKGQLVKIKVSSCPYPDYGILFGEVIAISPDAVMEDSDDNKEKKQTQNKIYYDITVQPETMTLSSPGGKECVLKSGMEAKTDIITKEETILQFFLRKARLLVDI